MIYQGKAMHETDLSEALFHPLRAGDLSASVPEARALFLRGTLGLWPDFLSFSPVFQSFSRRETDRIVRAGHAVVDQIAPGSVFDLVIVCAPRQTDEARRTIAEAIDALAPGGTILCGAAKTGGGMRLAGVLKDAGFADIGTDSRAHCRVVWARKDRALDTPRIEGWKQAGAVRRTPAGFFSCPGLFGWDRVDPGSALLAECLSAPLKGAGADFGCGYGFLSAHVLRTQPGISALAAIDDDSRAVACCTQNIRDLAGGAGRDVVWKDLSAPWDGGPVFDWIVMNPPFHEGAGADIALGQRFVTNAATALKPGGTLWMVANTHLPYAETLKASFQQVERCLQRSGFQIFRARK